MTDTSELIFVYNADSGIFSALKDFIHKSLSPETYACNLCGLTYSGAMMKREWRTCIDSLPLRSVFLHKDEFVELYPALAHTQFPAVFKKRGIHITEYISATEINNQHTIGDLKKLVKGKFLEV